MLLAGACKRELGKKQFFFPPFSFVAEDKRLAAKLRLRDGGYPDP